MKTTHTSPTCSPAAPLAGGSGDAEPNSGAIIHSVINRRHGAATVLDRTARARAETEREQLCSTLQRLHRIGELHTPAPLRRLVREAEVLAAAALLRRLALIAPALSPAQLLAHCERAATNEAGHHAHLIDPLQLRHLLTCHEDLPNEQFTAVELYELDRALEHGPLEQVLNHLRRLGSRCATLPRTTPALLRTRLLRLSASGTSTEWIPAVAFEIAVLDMRLHGPLGWENTRLFCALLKQIYAASIRGLESYLEAAEIAHAANRYRTAGEVALADYLRRLEAEYDRSALPLLERNIATAAEQRSRIAAAAVPAPGTPAVARQPRRRLLFGLLDLFPFPAASRS
ncbi:MAG TPA: hypothetical protein VK163_08465 [Opitutaceae bacterium]|nr:hypothetical protein [Opitutaceae bacterium]